MSNNQPNGRTEFLRTAERYYAKEPFDPRNQNPLQNAMENYALMETQIETLTEKNRQLVLQNTLLTAEVTLVRDGIIKAEKEAKRLQAVASTFGGQARALQAVFTSIMELAIKNGYEAAEATETAQEPVQKPEPYEPPDTGRDATASGAPPAVDWSSIPR